MPTAGRLRPPHRRRARGVVPRDLARISGCTAAVLAAALALAGPATAAGSSSSSSDNGSQGARGRSWAFIPLGPEGADLVSIVPLPEGGWLAQAARGQLFCWAPCDSTPGGGAWERVPLCADGAVHLVARVESSAGRSCVAALVSSGELLRWDSRETPGERSCEAGTESPSSFPFQGDSALGPGSRASDRGRGAVEGGLRPWAQLPEGRVLSAVSILPGEGAAGAPEVLIALRDGTFYAVSADGGLERWLARFHDPSLASSGDRGGDPLRIRLRWAGRLAGEPGSVLAITEWEGLYLSRDGGRLFAPIAGGLPKGVHCLVDVPGSGVLAGCAEGLYRASRVGATWQPCSEPYATGGSEAREFWELLPTAGQLLGRVADGKVYSSDDGGATWHPVLGDVPLRVRALACDPRGGEVLLAASRGALLSTDGGASWEWRNRGLRLAGVQAIALSHNGQQIFVGTDLGFFARSGEQGEWLPQLPCAASIAPSTPGELDEQVAAASETGAGLDLTTWQRLSGRVLALDLWESPAGLRLLCLGTESGPAVCSWQGAADVCRWDPDGPPEMATSILALPGGAACATGGIASETWAVWRGPRGDWTPIELPPRLTSALDPDGPPGTLVPWVGEEDGQVVLAGGGLTRLALWGAFDPLGAREAQRGEPLPLSAPSGCQVLTAAAAWGDLWTGTDDGLWRLREGDSWERVAFDGERVVRLCLAAGRPGLVACRVAGGVFLSEDDGRSWQALPVPEQLHVQSLAADQAGTRLYLGTQLGLFEVALGPSLGVATGSLDPEAAQPLEAQPNPFSAQVVVRGLLTGDPLSAVRAAGWGGEGVDAGAAIGSGEGAGGEGLELLIVNVHGQLVRRIAARAVVAAGDGASYLEWQWDGRDERGQAAPRGIYLVSARVGGTGFRGKVIKLR